MHASSNKTLLISMLGVIFMTTIQKTYLYLLMTFMTSCATLHQDKLHSQQVPINKDNYHLLDGHYSRNCIKKDSTRIQGNDLFWNFFRKGHHHMIQDENVCSVHLQSLSTKRLKVTYLKNDSIIDSLIMKGRLKNGYFELRGKYFIVPAIFFNICRTIRFRVGVLENGNLSADYREAAFGTGFVIIPFYEDDKNMDIEFKKK